MKNWKIGTRLGIGFALVVLLLMVVIGVSINRLALVNDSSTHIVQERLPKVDMARDVKDELNLIARGNRNILLVTEPEQVKFELDRMAKSRKAIADLMLKLEKQATTEEERAIFKKLADIRAPYVEAVGRFMKLMDERKKDEARDLLLKDIRKMQSAYFAVLEQFIAFQENLIKKAEQQATDTYKVARILLLVLGGIAVAMAAVVAFVSTRSITRPMHEAVRIADTVSSGDLTHRIEVHSTDETGHLMQALKNMNDSLLNIVGKVRADTDTIATASAQIAAGNQDLSSRTEEQASSLEETASSMEELTSTVRQNADNARHANQLAVNASDVASKGGEVVLRVVQTMNAINESSHKMADIINVIDGIAFQTNILALNAAVEAARAGEQGRGFAVVATEVRSLAQRSASAAREIKTLIDDSVEKVDTGSKLVEQAGATMEEVVASIKQVNDIMGEITAASREQSEGIEQVNQAVSQMDRVTQQNAALVEEAAAAAESLQDQAANLVQVVSMFKTGQENVAARAIHRSVASPKAVAKQAEKSVTVAKPAAELAAPANVLQLAANRTGAGKGEDWDEF
ncbi:MAG: methyl-accepting chemotaxis protein [Burkholderiaceae bacterium]|nr:methyl-accepting chemotaxis protein [Burkholderiaceae bacterium]